MTKQRGEDRLNNYDKKQSNFTTVTASSALQWKFTRLQNLIGDHAAEVGITGKFQIYPTPEAQGASVYGRFYWQSPGWFKNSKHRREWKISWGLFGSDAETEIL